MGSEMCIRDSTGTPQRVQVSSGVPQGSVIAPYLFAAHMGSLTPYNSRTSMTKYADDVVTITPVECLSDIENIINQEISHVDS